MPYNKHMDTETDKDWPNSFRTRKELDSMLEAGLASGLSELTWDEIIDEAKKELGLK
jgi:hypothetical protein